MHSYPLTAGDQGVKAKMRLTKIKLLSSYFHIGENVGELNMKKMLSDGWTSNNRQLRIKNQRGDTCPPPTVSNQRVKIKMKRIKLLPLYFHIGGKNFRKQKNLRKLKTKSTQRIK